MAQARDSTGANFTWPYSAVAKFSLFKTVADIRGKLLESVVGAQKDWAEFVHRRVKEDIAASQKLMKCQSLVDMQDLYSRYLQTAFEQYQEQSERAVQRGTSMTKELAQQINARVEETTEPARH
jgi:Phasin protein